MEVREGKCLKIIIGDGGIFLGEDKVKKIFQETEYRENEDLYIFQETIPGVHEMTIHKGHQLQMIIKDLENESYIDVLRKIFGQEDDKEWLWSIRNVSCMYFERYTSRTHQELVEYGVHNLLPDLRKDEWGKSTQTWGVIEDNTYETYHEITRGQARSIGMEDALTFTSKTIMKCENIYRWRESVEDLVKQIRKMLGKCYEL